MRDRRPASAVTTDPTPDEHPGEGRSVANPRRSNGHRRNQVRRQVLAEESYCALCGELVDKALTFVWGEHGPRCTDPSCPGCVPHPMRAEVDEIVPVSQGGSPFDRRNCRLAHRLCNQRRGNRTFVPPTPVVRETYPTSRSW